MGKKATLGAVLKGAGRWLERKDEGETISFLQAFERKRPSKTIENIHSNDLDTLSNMIKTTMIEKIVGFDPQDNSSEYSTFCSNISGSVKELKKICSMMEKLDFKEMLKDYNKDKKVLEKQINFITNIKSIYSDDYYDNMKGVKADIDAVNKAIDAINKLRKDNSKLLNGKTGEYGKFDYDGGKKGVLIKSEFLSIFKKQTEYRDKNVEEAKKYVKSLINSKEETTKEEKIKVCKQEITKNINESVKSVGLKFDLEDISNILDDGFNPDEIYANFVNANVADKIVKLARGGNIIQGSGDFKDKMLEELAKPKQERKNFAPRVFFEYFNSVSGSILKKQDAANKEKNEIDNNKEWSNAEKARRKQAINNNLAKYTKKVGNDIIKIKYNIDGFITSFANKWDSVKKSFAEFENVKEGNFDNDEINKYNNALRKFIEEYDKQLSIIKKCYEKSENYKKADYDACKEVLNSFKNSDKMFKTLLSFNKNISKINDAISKCNGYISKAKIPVKKIKDRIDKYVGDYGKIFEDSNKGFSDYVDNGVIKVNKLRSLDYTNIPACLTLAQAIIIFYKYIDGYEQNDFNIFKTKNNDNIIKSYLEERDKLKLGNFSPKEIAEVKAAVEK